MRLGIIVLPLLATIVKATVCPLRIESTVRGSTVKHLFDAKFTSANVIRINATSAFSCIHRCLKECLCYHANYKAIDALAFSCELVKYAKCGTTNGVLAREGAGWSSVKLKKVSAASLHESFDVKSFQNSVE